ncbi:hypothetical protein BVX95_02115 [archaeon D22]|nr:hypothetical protein BVX95_02115 [archaeon D22]
MKQKVFFNSETLKTMSLFEKVTRSRLKDCFEDNNNLLIFVVDSGELKKAVGKAAANVKKLETMLKRKIRIIEYHDNITRFIKSLIFPMKVADIEIGTYDQMSSEEKAEAIITIIPQDHKTRGLIIGRNASNLRNYEFIVKKYFPIRELKVQ